MTKSAIVHLLLDPKLVQRLDAMALDHRKSRDALADLAIRNLLALHDWQKEREPGERRPMDHRAGLPVPPLVIDDDDADEDAEEDSALDTGLDEKGAEADASAEATLLPAAGGGSKP